MKEGRGRTGRIEDCVQTWSGRMLAWSCVRISERKVVIAEQDENAWPTRRAMCRRTGKGLNVLRLVKLTYPSRYLLQLNHPVPSTPPPTLSLCAPPSPPPHPLSQHPHHTNVEKIHHSRSPPTSHRLSLTLSSATTISTPTASRHPRRSARRSLGLVRLLIDG